MLKALRSQLSILAIDNGAVFAAAIKKRMGRQTTQPHVSQALSLVLVMPDLIAKTRDLSQRKEVPSGKKSQFERLMARQTSCTASRIGGAH